MTGTGTQADPYIVDNWKEFVTAVGKSGYVKCAENLTWNMNDIAPEGVDGVTINATEIDGNGLTINNLYLIGNNGIINNNAVTIKNMSILNLKTKASGCAFYANYRMNLYLVQVSGIIECTAFVRVSSSFYASRCSFNLTFAGNSCFGSGGSVNLSFCNIKLNGISGAAFDGSGRGFNCSDCLIHGIYPFTTLPLAYSTDNVIDCEFARKASISSGSCTNILINKDKLTNVSSGIPSAFATVTTSQLEDAAYLASLGFPIGVE